MTKVASPSSDPEPLGVPEGGILRATASGRGELSTSWAGYLTGDLLVLGETLRTIEGEIFGINL